MLAFRDEWLRFQQLHRHPRVTDNMTITVSSLWLRLQGLRFLQLIIAAILFGGSLSALLGQNGARPDTYVVATNDIGTRLAVSELKVDQNSKQIENITPRVEHLENELGKLYGIGVAIGALLGLINGGQILIAAKTIKAQQKAPMVVSSSAGGD